MARTWPSQLGRLLRGFGPSDLLDGLAWPRGLPLRLEGVWVRRGQAEILRGIDLTFEPARRYVVVGASGAGKSTLLRLLNRLDDPDEGKLGLGATALADLPVRVVRRSVGLVFQNPRPLPCTVAENLAYAFEVVGRDVPGLERLSEALTEVGLDPAWLDRGAMGLSGGEKQRLALTMVLLTEPEILALDEPTAGLDPASARRVADVLARRVASSGLRTITVSHHREHAAWLGETTIVLDAGRAVDSGPTGEVLPRIDSAVWAGSDTHRSP